MPASLETNTGRGNRAEIRFDCLEDAFSAPSQGANGAPQIDRVASTDSLSPRGAKGGARGAPRGARRLAAAGQGPEERSPGSRMCLVRLNLGKLFYAAGFGPPGSKMARPVANDPPGSK